jgi:hypothetical protein
MSGFAGKLGHWARRKLEEFSLTEISSRPLGLFRIFAILTILYQYTPHWVGHKLDDHALELLSGRLFLIAAWFVLIGYKTRIATAVMALAGIALHLYYGVELDKHLLYKPVQMFQVVVLMALTPVGRSLSVDRAIEVRRARAERRSPAPETVPWWQVELFILQICAIYLWAAENKSDEAWFRGERMERYWVEWFGGSDSLAFKPLVHPIAVFFAWATTILEYALAFGLLSRRLRPYLMWGGVMLHIGILYTVAVTYFSSMMLCILGLCMPPQVVHDFIARLTRDSNGRGDPPERPR